MPRANTGSAFLNWVSDTFTFLLQFERRFDPWLRPPFDAVLRDPVARLVTALINRKRPNEGLKIAEEKPLPDEEAVLDSIIASFREADARALEARRIRAWRKHEDARHRARGIYRARQSPRRIAPRHLREAANLSRLGPFFRTRSLHHARHRRSWVS